ncbi:hypothetical protein JTE90_017786 [Oedothorax gibbosus]|uniref:CAP-Gly domain-containing protein n=1 Tax=Oedothorax gibbosus TaxID=931172 RepID=A0AAV6UMM0_9ARAC|nr:hypothetical protein JTE90_017786 [Oedothorax gibbosus]
MLVSTLMHKDWYAWIGKRVSVNNDVGTLKYFGEIKAKSGFWCGIEFDEPIGVTDGTISGIQYFKCETNFGIFVPMHEVNRSTELTHCLDMKKPKVNVLHGAAIKKPKSQRSVGSLNRIFDKNRNKPGNSCDTNTKVENTQADIKNVNVRKRSKNSSHRVGTEESLGILSNLLEDDGSWDELATHEKEEDSVFSPPITKGLPDLKPQLYQTQFDKQVPFNIKCASTPKPSFKSVMNLGATIKLDDLQFDHSFHDEIEPIIAGSNATKSMDFDLTNFKQSEVLCSTSKLTLPILPKESPLLNKMPCIKNEELDGNGSFKNEDNVESRVSVNTCSLAQEVPKSTNTNVFNATYELIPEQLENCNAQSEQDTNEILVLHPTAVNSNKKSTGMVDLNATFVLCSNSPSPAKEADKTFVLDHSPAKPLEQSSSVESEINFEKKSLSVIFENTMNESLSVNNAVEHIDKVQAISNPNLVDDINSMNLKISSKMMDKFDNISNSSLKITDGKEIVSDLNSTFCITVENVKSKDNPVLNNVNKRCSLSSISAINNISTKQRKSDILDNKCIKHPQSINNQKTTFKIPAPYGATMKTKVIKNSTISISNKKDEVRDKIISEDTSKSSSNDNMKAKGIEATSRLTEPQKRIVNSYKSVNRQTQQKENEVHVTLKITDKNTQIVARRKSVGGVVTKVTSQISYGSNRKSIYENSNINLKEIKKFNAFNSNLTNAKNGVVNRRHTMVPAISSIGTQAKAGVAISKSDLSSNIRSDNIPMSLKDKSLQSSSNQDSFGNKNKHARDNLIKKPAEVERPKEDIPKDISSKLENKQNGKPIVSRRELLKPGTLSRLPIAAKSIKKPGFLATGAKPIKT